MNPFRRSPKQWLTMGLLWSLICLWVTILHRSLLNSSWAESALLTLPATAVLLFPSLGVGFICKAVPPSRKHLFKTAGVHAAAMTAITGVWLLLVMLYASGLDVVFKTDTRAPLFHESLPLFMGVGVSIYLFSALVYYLVLADERTRDREKELLEQRLMAGQAELKALKSTIHPHFVFNSLNMIGPLIRRSPQRAESFISELSEFLLYSLRYGKQQQVTVSEEVEHITNYLAIEKERLGDRLTTDLETAPDTLPRPILPLTLLPLVENAVKHGIQPSLTGGVIRVTVEDDGSGGLRVTVTNPYEPPTRRPNGEGLGLTTLKHRIHVYYGPSARVKTKKENDLFTVTLHIPKGGRRPQEEK